MLDASQILSALAISAAPTLAIIVNALINWRADRRNVAKLADIETIGQRTNTLVNGQRLELLRLIKELRVRIAEENPADPVAAGDAKRALANLDEALLSVDHDRRRHLTHHRRPKAPGPV